MKEYTKSAVGFLVAGSIVVAGRLIYNVLVEISDTLAEMNKTQFRYFGSDLTEKSNHTQNLLKVNDQLGEIKTLGQQIKRHYTEPNVECSDPKQMFQYTLERLCRDEKKEGAKVLFDAWQSTFPEDQLD